MYQQNQMINTQAGQAQALHLHLNEQDVANLVLSELKRTAREYTTAALEATHPAIRQMFASLSQKTLQDQAELFDVLSQLGGYGSIKMATQLEVQQELSQQIQKAEQLQAIVQQAVHGSFAGGAYQQPFGQQQPSFQPSQPSYAQMPGYAAGSSHYGGMLSSSVSGQQNQSQTSSAGYSQSPAASSFGSSVQTGYGYGASSVEDSEHNNVKSSVSGTDVSDYYATKASQDYTNASAGAKYGSNQQAYGSQNQQEQSYASTGYNASATGRQGQSATGYGFNGSSDAATSSSVSSSSNGIQNKAQSAQQQANASKYVF
ncbi:spore coat protein [Paenibacillus sp. tmac-D7]|uniref:spore coat protein n=1 Tax=Paenibacillus sp. tmac-D7 TaxID=2591462 RepID=UPI0011425D3D|nr:spore coat protein [Paenibacillus sp. tmac-D7]